MSNLRDEINKVVRSSPAVVQMYDEASQEGLPVLIDDLVALFNKHEREARIDELYGIDVDLNRDKGDMVIVRGNFDEISIDERIAQLTGEEE